MKRFLKQHISHAVWKRFRDIKKWIRREQQRKAFWRVPWFSLVWLAGKVFVKESLRTVGKLDYPHADIFFDVHTTGQLTRLYGCRKEPETVAWIEKNMRHGDVLYDIGANVGAYSFVASAVAGKKCTIYAFEPDRTVFDALGRNIDLNNCAECITPLPIALDVRQSITPLSFRLDDAIRIFDLRAPTLIKIDVDGAERGVIAGAQKTLENASLRSVLIEIDESVSDYRDIVYAFDRSGFRITSKNQRGSGGTVYNYIFER